MSNTINNLKKEIEVGFSIDHVSSRMRFLCTDSKYYRSVDESESILGLYKYHFKKPIAGVINNGMQVHISLINVDSTKTKITIEIIDNWDGTDSRYDITSANILMDEVTRSLSNIILSPIENLETKASVIETSENFNNTTFDSSAALYGLIIFFIIIAYVFFF